MSAHLYRFYSYKYLGLPIHRLEVLVYLGYRITGARRLQSARKKIYRQNIFAGQAYRETFHIIVTSPLFITVIQPILLLLLRDFIYSY